jgi:PTH1 family peptidyl-tRNA hydrolase
MTWVIIGLGNPDEEHVRTRHNAGRMAVEYFAKKNALGEWKEDKKSKSFVVRGAIGKQLVVCVLPNTYMNKSGSAAMHYVKSVKAAEKLVVVYDELDMPFGKLKIVFDRGSGGHKGIESIARALKTKAFSRVRIGISRVDGKGEAQKPHGERDVEKFILGEFSSGEFSQLKDIFKKTAGAIEAIVTEGREKAMNSFN